MLPKSFIGLIAAGLVVLAVLGFGFVLLGPGTRPTVPPLPNPNGYDDFLRARKVLSGYTMDLASPEVPLDKLRAFVAANQRTLELIRLGLSRECRVPSYSPTNLLPGVWGFSKLYPLSLTLMAEGRVAEIEGRRTDAVNSYLDGVRFGHECGRGGVIMEKLAATAIERGALARLLDVEPELGTNGCQRIIYCSVQKLNDIKPPPGYTWYLASERKIGFGRSAFAAILVPTGSW
ncbi:MAG: hypothetical protein HYY24_16230, partial [Verrucomicrobia bacterium]|nr:hypothetical protein [Verrucomicrobiota bacterium]